MPCREANHHDSHDQYSWFFHLLSQGQIHRGDRSISRITWRFPSCRTVSVWETVPWGSITL
jgi:hypothetical protein